MQWAKTWGILIAMGLVAFIAGCGDDNDSTPPRAFEGAYVGQITGDVGGPLEFTVDVSGTVAGTLVMLSESVFNGKTFRGLVEGNRRISFQSPRDDDNGQMVFNGAMKIDASTEVLSVSGTWRNNLSNVSGAFEATRPTGAPVGCDCDCVCEGCPIPASMFCPASDTSLCQCSLMCEKACEFATTTDSNGNAVSCGAVISIPTQQCPVPLS